jgi:hypothetical protein
MAPIGRVGDLEIDQDLDFQGRMYVIERIGWVAILLLLILALLGLAGNGPLSQADVGAADSPLHIRYDRIARAQAPAQVQFSVQPGMAREGVLHLWLDRDYLERAHIQQVVPQPSRLSSGQDRLIYQFDVDESGTPSKITFYLEPDQVGLLGARAGLVDGPTLEFRQLILP